MQSGSSEGSVLTQLIHEVALTGSTNDDLLALAHDGAPEGVWLRADTQTGGKGRSGRQWISPPGNFYASTLVRVRDSDPLMPSLALVSGIALYEAVVHFTGCDGLMLKWPNDLLGGQTKLGGILLEGAGRAVVCGFGVNLAHHPDIADRAVTSVAGLAGAAPSPGVFLEYFTPVFAKWLAVWRTEGLEAILAQWVSRAHPAGTPLAADVGSGGRVEGLFDGLDAMGSLRLRLADGTTRVIQAGDVFLS